MKVCTIGGGSGMSVVNQALVKSGIGWVSSIVTVFDSGGDTGRLRTDERGNLLAFSDYWRSLMSLWRDGAQKQKWLEMLRFRDDRDRNFGNLFFMFLKEKVLDMNAVGDWFKELVVANMAGEVVPVCLSPANLCFKVKSGVSYSGEHRLDELRMSKDEIREMWLDPAVEINEKAVKCLEGADLIVVCPGSMYGSVLANFATKGFVGAFLESKAKKILMTNIMSVRNENDGFDQDRYVSVFADYIGKKSVFDLVLMADLNRLDKIKLKRVLENYELEYSRPIICRKESVAKTELIDIAMIEEKNMRLRHSVDKLSGWFKNFGFGM